MERGQLVTESINTLRALQRKARKPGARIHEDTIYKNSFRLKALEGICGQCENINPELDRVDGKNVVRLRCRADLSPLRLYEDAEFGKTPECPSFAPVEKTQKR